MCGVLGAAQVLSEAFEHEVFPFPRTPPGRRPFPEGRRPEGAAPLRREGVPRAVNRAFGSSDRRRLSSERKRPEGADSLRRGGHPRYKVPELLAQETAATPREAAAKQRGAPGAPDVWLK